MKLKICGMKYQENIEAVATLRPDYMGFIFYEGSKRNFDRVIPNISKDIKKTGVFVNASIEFVLKKVIDHGLKAVQLHGDESMEYCKKLREKKLEVIKVFSVGEQFSFDVLKKYEEVCHYFLFDTKGKERGGNGITFNWEILNQYPFHKPYFLSGGIGLEEVESLNLFLRSKASKYCYAIDVNSKFEIEPGLKDQKKLKNFMEHIKL
jgi:phosphoribosylanthranilate isomerase